MLYIMSSILSVRYVVCDTLTFQLLSKNRTVIITAQKEYFNSRKKYLIQSTLNLF